VTVPLGGVGSGSLRLWLITSPASLVPSLFPSLADGEAGGGVEKCQVEQSKRPLNSTGVHGYLG